MIAEVVDIELVVVPVDFSYMLSRLPAPQVSAELPGQAKLQSVSGASTLPELMVFSQ